MFIIFTIVYYTKLIFSKLLINKCLTKVKTVLKKSLLNWFISENLPTNQNISIFSTIILYIDMTVLNVLKMCNALKCSY